MKVLCNVCGNILVDASHFCPMCGAPTSFYYSQVGGVGENANGASTFVKVGDQKVFTDYGILGQEGLGKSVYEPLNPYRIVPPPPPQKRSKMRIIIGSVIVFVVIPVLILSGFGAYTLLAPRAKTSAGELVVGSSATASSKVILVTPTVMSNVMMTSVAVSATSVVATAAVTIVPTSVVSNTCGAFSDYFANELQGGWVWVDPAGHGRYDSGSGVLTITAAGNSDLNGATNTHAPRILQPIQQDFTIETQVMLPGRLPRGFVAAGLLLWQDTTNFLRLERSATTFDFEQEVNGVFNHDAPQSLAAATIPVAQVELQLKRVGDSFTASWRIPGQSWELISTANVHFQNMQVGLFLVNESVGLVTVSYHYFKVVCG